MAAVFGVVGAEFSPGFEGDALRGDGGGLLVEPDVFLAGFDGGGKLDNLYECLTSEHGADKFIDSQERAAQDHEHAEDHRRHRFDGGVVGEFARHDHLLFFKHPFDLFEVFLSLSELFALAGDFFAAGFEKRCGFALLFAVGADDAGLAEQRCALFGLLGVDAEVGRGGLIGGGCQARLARRRRWI